MKKIFIVLLLVIMNALSTNFIVCEAQAPSSEAKYGGILRISESVPLDLPFGDPLNVIGPAAMRTSISLERLLLWSDTPKKFEYVLATGFKLAPDNSYYDISLREGVKFHDGTDFNAKAVKWNLGRVLKAPRNELRKVKSIDIIDDYTIRLNLSSWDNRILNDLMNDCCLMISPTAFEKNGGSDWANFHPIGTGPFVFKEIKTNQAIIFERNNNYWRNGLPYLDGLEVRIIPDPMVFEAALKAGEVDCTWEGNEKFMTQIDANPNSKFKITPGKHFQSSMMFYMNTMDPNCAWYDPRMRQAFEYALNKDKTMKAVGSPYREPLYTIIRGLEEVTELSTKPRKYNPDKAKELMKAAGYPNGLKFDIYIIPIFWNSMYERSVMLAYQEQLAEVGFNAEFKVIELATHAQMGKKPLPGNSVRVEALRGNAFNPVDVVIESLSEKTIFFNGVKRPIEWPGLLEQALQTKDINKEIAILSKMEEIAYDQAMIIPIMGGSMSGIATKRLHDIVFDRKGIQAENAWLSD